MTTGSFTAEARREATRDGVPPIELIDSEKLVDMLAKLELGLDRSRPMRSTQASSRSLKAEISVRNTSSSVLPLIRRDGANRNA